MSGVGVQAFNAWASWQRKTTVNSHGEPGFSGAIDVQARVEPVSRMIRRADGETVEARAKIFTTAGMVVGDRVTVSGETYTVLDSVSAVGLDGLVNHYEVSVG
jgi:hypothetical protein